MLKFTIFWSRDQNTTKLSREKMAVELNFVDDESVLAFISAAEKEIHLENEFNLESKEVSIAVSISCNLFLEITTFLSVTRSPIEPQICHHL